MFEMLSGKPPFDATNHFKLLKIITESLPLLQFPDYISNSAFDLLKSLLQKDPSKRCTFDAFFGHPFIRGQLFDKSFTNIPKKISKSFEHFAEDDWSNLELVQHHLSRGIFYKQAIYEYEACVLIIKDHNISEVPEYRLLIQMQAIRTILCGDLCEKDDTLRYMLRLACRKMIYLIPHIKRHCILCTKSIDYRIEKFALDLAKDALVGEVIGWKKERLQEYLILVLTLLSSKNEIVQKLLAHFHFLSLSSTLPFN